MFVQLIQARVKDAAGLDAATQRWQRDLKPGAKGWLGVTSGTTKNGELVTVVRFDSEQSARANSERPEQGAWFAEMSRNLEGDVTFFDATDVDTFGSGGSDDAGFVQIITGTGKDKKRLKEIDQEMGAAASEQRPDVIGGISAWSGDRFVQVIYFTSEKEARANEGKGFAGDAKKLMDESQALMDDVRFFDLSDPKMESA